MQLFYIIDVGLAKDRYDVAALLCNAKGVSAGVEITWELLIPRFKLQAEPRNTKDN